MKSFFALTLVMFLAITLSACGTAKKTDTQTFCVHPLINGGGAFPLLPTTVRHANGDLSDKGIVITNAMCAIVTQTAE